VSHLKKHLGPHTVLNPNQTLLDDNGFILVQPEALLDRKAVLRVQGNIIIHVVKCLIKWVNFPADQATWEDSGFIKKTFPQLQPRGQVCAQYRGIVRTQGWWNWRINFSTIVIHISPLLLPLVVQSSSSGPHCYTLVSNGKVLLATDSPSNRRQKPSCHYELSDKATFLYVACITF
jgi:hypothetical protein